MGEAFPSFPDFRGLELSDRAEMERRLDGAHPGICELAFANLYIWKDFDDPRVTLINGNICLLMSPPDETAYFLEPIGGLEIEATADICLETAGRISRASHGFVGNLSKGRYRLKERRDHHDYVYLTREMADLKGRRHDGKRNHIKAFGERFPRYRLVDLGAGDVDRALGVYDEWRRGKNGTSGSDSDNEMRRRALARAFEAHDGLGLMSFGIEVGARLAGFMVANALCPRTACVPFMFCVPGIRGSTQTLLSEACAGPLSAFRYINLEQDLGFPGLRKFKQSYHPARMERKFDVTRR